MDQVAAELIPDSLAALADGGRLSICYVLENQELTVGELCRVVQLPQSTVSRRLKQLSDAGWLQKRGVGPTVFYRLSMDDLPPHLRGLWLALREHRPETVEELMRRVRAVVADRSMDSAAYFGHIGGQWEEIRRELFGASFTAHALVGLLPRKWTVVDLGCGTGSATAALAPHVERVVAVDQSAAMLDAGRGRLVGCDNVAWVPAPVERTGLPAASADAVICLLVLHHVDRPELVLREMARLLRPGGVALVVDMVSHDRAEYRQTMGHKHLGFAEGDIEARMSAAGLTEACAWRLPIDAEARGPALFAARGVRE
ncbi:MAG: metalloregulator ArsR/SmtB family transcription factor [Phycisphaerales bacterium]|nr:metalloregulator ArsR/SmtB family transcription factor [Phycisphaerales bacterium]